MNNPFYNAFQPVRYKSKNGGRSVRARPSSSNGNGRPRKKIKSGKLYGATAKKELKFYDTSTTKALTTTMANVFSATAITMNTIPQGSTQVTRIGNEAIIKKIQVRGYLQFHGVHGTTLNGQTNMARIMIVVDHQPNGAILPAGDILESTTQVSSMRNLDTSNRITVLYDKTFAANLNTAYRGTVGSIASSDMHIPFSFFKTLNMKTQYDGTTQDIASIATNSIICYAMIEDAAAACTIELVTRARYTG